jgi:hypothetical protein
MNGQLKSRLKKMIVMILLGWNSCSFYILLYYSRILHDNTRYILEISYCMAFTFYYSSNIQKTQKK